VDVWDVAVAVAGQAPLVAVAVVVLYLLLSREIRNEVRRVERRIDRLEERVAKLEERTSKIEEQMGRVEGHVGQLVKAFQIYNSTLLKVLSSKGVLTEAEAEALSSHLLYVPPAKSKYFTEEVRQRLIEILKGVKEGRYTVADVKELRRISELIEKEGWENNRKDLLDYNLKLQMLIAILEGRLIARGEWRPEWDLEDW
jgi:polyhydroxyalkanoate synthesis regulator phasin